MCVCVPPNHEVHPTEHTHWCAVCGCGCTHLNIVIAREVLLQKGAWCRATATVGTRPTGPTSTRACRRRRRHRHRARAAAAAAAATAAGGRVAGTGCNGAGEEGGEVAGGCVRVGGGVVHADCPVPCLRRRQEDVVQVPAAPTPKTQQSQANQTQPPLAPPPTQPPSSLFFSADKACNARTGH